MSLFLKDEAYEQLVQMIDDGKFEYDKKYSLNQIAIELNMSKTPVRDAIQKLADEKRIDILPSRGIQPLMKSSSTTISVTPLKVIAWPNSPKPTPKIPKIFMSAD